MESSETEPGKPSRAHLKFIREVLANEIAHRRDRRNKIFSWVSSLLVGITGGVVALTYRSHVQLGTGQRIVLTLSTLTLSGHAGFWIYQHWQVQNLSHERLADVDQKLGVPPQPHLKFIAGHGIALALLTLAAVAAIWMPGNP